MSVLAFGSCKSDSTSQTPALLGLSITGSGSGSVVASAAGIACTISGGTATGSCYAQLAAGTAVTLTATPASGATFVAWSGGCTGATPTCELTLTTSTSVQAEFSGTSASLTVALTGSGAGSILSTPAGISCARDAGMTSGTCVASYPLGSSVILTATPGVQNILDRWDGDCSGSETTCTVLMSGPRSVSANVLPARVVTISGAGAGSGTVTSSPAGLSCTVAAGMVTGQCSASFGDGAAVVLTATPSSGSVFSSWSGACSGSSSPCNLIVSASGGVQASFVPFRALTVSGAGTGAGTVTSVPAGINCSISAGIASGTCMQSIPDATSVTLSAASAAGSTFSGWSGDCTGASCVLALTADRSVVATFAGPSGTPTATVALSPTSIMAGGSSTVTVTVKDAGGNPLQGAAVVLAVASGGSATITQPVGMTDANGIATGAVTATVVGSRTIAATINGTVTVTQQPTLTVTAGSPYAITQSGGFVTTGARFGQNVPSLPIVFVSDGYGNGVPGVAVTFTLTRGRGLIGAGAATGTTLQAITNVAGAAELSLWSLASVSSAGNYDAAIDVNNTVTAGVTGLVGSPVQFTTTVSVSYANDVQSIWNNSGGGVPSCSSSGCHAVGGTAPVLAGASRGNLTGVYITPGDSTNFSNSANRLLYRLINGSPVMPSGYPSLPANVVGIIKAYIQQGAPSN